MAKQAEMKIRVLSVTPDAERVCATTARQCMTSMNADQIYAELTDGQIESTLRHCIRSGHLAVLSSAHATVGVNVTRECLTQLNTHAFIKTVTQSQQYVDHRDFRYHVPEVMLDDKEQLDRFIAFMNQVQVEYIWHRDRIYNKLINLGFSKEKALDQAKSNARGVLPNVAEANTVLSGNLWAWYNWLSTRVCKRNTPVTLRLAQMILAAFRSRWPRIFGLCGAPCELGKCKEQRPCDDGPYERLAI